MHFQLDLFLLLLLLLFFLLLLLLFPRLLYPELTSHVDASHLSTFDFSSLFSFLPSPCSSFLLSMAARQP